MNELKQLTSPEEWLRKTVFNISVCMSFYANDVALFDGLLVQYRRQQQQLLNSVK